MITKLTFLGDIMCEQAQNEACYTKKEGYNYSKIFDKSISDLLSTSDYVIGNLETPIAGEDLKYSNELYSFNTPKEFLKTLKDIGISIVSTANNHCLDRGVEGLSKTMEALDEADIKYTGTFKTRNENRFLIIENKNIRVSILSYTYGTNAAFNKQYLNNNNKYMVNLFKEQEKDFGKYNVFRRAQRKMRHINVKNSKFLDYFYLKKLKADIKEAKKNSDLVIMCMHSGGQYNDIVDDYTKFLGNYLLENGVDFVVGAHPHVVHDCYIKSSQVFCAHSLGNFSCTPWKYKEQKDNLPDYSIVLNIYIDNEQKKVSQISFSITKSIFENNFSKVITIEELIKKSTEKEIMTINNEVDKIIKKFTNKARKDLEEEKGEFIVYRG